ncbi:MAG: pro-sigmaK processing inhibitor BofA family protein [Clostridia bacterium]|nr:pro-sigmaK processing inhibitor BofA family protein [Clostridia bacterium]
MTVLLYVIAGIAVLAAVVGAVCTKKPIRTLLGSALQGLCALAAVNVTGAFTGVSLGINVLTGSFCILGGVPGVITLLLLKVILAI